MHTLDTNISRWPTVK